MQKNSPLSESLEVNQINRLEKYNECAYETQAEFLCKGVLGGVLWIWPKTEMDDHEFNQVPTYVHNAIPTVWIVILTYNEC